MSEEQVLFEVDDRVAVIRLNRPNSLNALNEAMRNRLDEIFQEVDQRRDIRVVTIFGEGRAFCAGQDLKEGSLNHGPAEYLQKKWESDFQTRLEHLNKPTIAGLHGYVIGRGLEVALTCDIRIAADNALMSLPEIKLGMIPGAGGTQRLTHLIGQARALQIILTGERIDAHEALMYGLVTKVAAADELRNTVMNTARTIAEGAPAAVRFARHAVRQANSIPLNEGLRMEAALQATLMATEDRAEGIRAFREGRKANFVGR